ncbi:MAG: uacT 2 [Firmicutes bacterium]|nr:uacT 2 [Bacillota bacterium]
MIGNTRHPVDEMLPIGQLFIYGLQHVLAMYAGAVAVPLIIANAIGLSQEQLIFLINADLFTCGIATLIQTLGFGNMGIRIPMIQGVTFAAVTPMIIIGKTHGMTAIYGSIIVAGLVTYLAAPYFSRLIRFFPPVVTGTIITIIGVTLMPVAVRWAAGGNPAAKDYGSLEYIAMAFVVMLLVLFFYKYFTGFLSNIAVLLGLICGTIMAIPLGMVNFSQVGTAGWIGVTTPFWFGMPTFDLASIAAMILVMLVVMTETTGDCIAIGEIIEKPIHKDDLARCLRADGFSTMLGGILNSFPYTAFAQNVGLVGLTRVKSRFVVAAAGVILIALGMVPKLAAVIAAIPNPVLGGAGIVMFGMVAASGIKTLSKVNFDGTYNIMVVGISVGIGMITLAVPNFYHAFPSWLQVILHSGITAGSLAAIVLNLLLNGSEAAQDVTAKEVAANETTFHHM